MKNFITLAAIATLVVIAMTASEVYARTPLKNICRVKGQEQNTLRGLGLVVGLDGTGDPPTSLPTLRALARSMELMGNPVGNSLKGAGGLAELKDAKNVALVWVTATVPATGARRGDQLDCSVSAISAKSLAGGHLVFSALQGPSLQDSRVFAMAEGRIELDNARFNREGRIFQGARMEEDVFTPFVKNGRITLVLDANHADFHVANEVAHAINTQLNWRGGEGSPGERFNDRDSNSDQADEIADPIDSTNIVVQIPNQYRDAPVQFVAQILELQLFELQTESRVVINQRAGSIVIGGDVRFGPVLIAHKNYVVETDAEIPPAHFVPIDPQRLADQQELKSLLEALNAMNVPADDVIEIIKGIDRNGQLHAKLIVQ